MIDRNGPATQSEAQARRRTPQGPPKWRDPMTREEREWVLLEQERERLADDW